MNEKKNKIKVLILDCDGVMFDSQNANINFYNQILRHFKLPPMSPEEEAFVHMHTAEESVHHIFRNSELAEQAQSYRMQMNYGPFIKDMIPEPGLKEMLKTLHGKIGLAVATNRSNTIETVLKSNDLSQYFDIVISSLRVKKPKPHPESIQKILNFFDVTSKDVLFVGDSQIDFLTAQAAKVGFISYKNNKLTAWYHCNHLLDLVDMVFPT